MIGAFYINSPLPNSSGPVDIHLKIAPKSQELEIDKKVNAIMKGYLTHPDRQGFLSTITNSIYEFFKGKTAIKIIVVEEWEGKIPKKTRSLYVKISDLKKTETFTKHEIKALENQEIAQKTTFIMRRIGKNAFQAQQQELDHLQSAKFERKIKEDPTLQKHFATLLDDSPLLDDEEEEPLEMVKESAPEKEELQVENAITPVQEERLEPSLSGSPKEEHWSNYVDLENFPDHAALLGLAEKQIGNRAMVSLLKQSKDENSRQRMLRTLIYIGFKINELNLSKGQEGVNLYIKRVSLQDYESNAFAISDTHIFICLPKLDEDNLLGQGGTKIVTTALKIERLKDENFASPIQKIVRLKTHLKESSEINLANEEMAQESAAISHLKGRCEYIASPYDEIFYPDNLHNKMIAFQENYEQSDRIFSLETPVELRVKAFTHIAKGLAFLHDQGLVHSDVKMENILLKGERALVTDFGAMVKQGEAIKGGTGMFSAPEALIAQRVKSRGIVYSLQPIPATPELDIYSFGGTLLDAVAYVGKGKFEDKDLRAPTQLMKYAQKQNKDPQAAADAYFEDVKKSLQETYGSAIDKLEKEGKQGLANELKKTRDFELHLADIAHQCMKFNPAERISMKRAVEMIEEFQI